MHAKYSDEYKKHARRLVLLLHKWHGFPADIAEDAVQDVFVYALACGVEPKYSLWAWLRMKTVGRAKNLMNRKALTGYDDKRYRSNENDFEKRILAALDAGTVLRLLNQHEVDAYAHWIASCENEVVRGEFAARMRVGKHRVLKQLTMAA